MAACENKHSECVRRQSAVLRNDNHILRCSLKNLLDHPERYSEKLFKSIVSFCKGKCEGNNSCNRMLGNRPVCCVPNTCMGCNCPPLCFPKSLTPKSCCDPCCCRPCRKPSCPTSCCNSAPCKPLCCKPKCCRPSCYDPCNPPKCCDPCAKPLCFDPSRQTLTIEPCTTCCPNGPFCPSPPKRFTGPPPIVLQKTGPPSVRHHVARDRKRGCFTSLCSSLSPGGCSTKTLPSCLRVKPMPVRRRQPSPCCAAGKKRVCSPTPTRKGMCKTPLHKVPPSMACCPKSRLSNPNSYMMSTKPFAIPHTPKYTCSKQTTKPTTASKKYLAQTRPCCPENPCQRVRFC